jgi:hypothetical protein
LLQRVQEQSVSSVIKAELIAAAKSSDEQLLGVPGEIINNIGSGHPGSKMEDLFETAFKAKYTGSEIAKDPNAPKAHENGSEARAKECPIT